MQTFLPYPDFDASCACLDYRRLGKQRVEAMQIIRALEGTTKAWRYHPCTQMWENYLPALKLYHNTYIDYWIARGYKNTMQKYHVGKNIKMPPWFGVPAFHAEQRASLLAKNIDHYSKFGWTGEPNLYYSWETWRTYGR